MVLEYKLLAKNMLFNKVFFFLLAISRFFFFETELVILICFCRLYLVAGNV